jgi:hypothetical protein
VDTYQFRHPEAQLFADLLIVKEGVRRASDYIRPLCTATFANLTVDATEMHWTTALIRYARVFPYGGGVLKWDADGALARLDARDQATHRYSFDVRSGYLAHSVGEFEDATPTVQVEVEDGAWSVVGIGSRVTRIAGPGSVAADNFFRLTQNLLGVVQCMIDSERVRLRPIAQGLGPAYFSVAADESGAAVSKGRPKKRRARFNE